MELSILVAEASGQSVGEFVQRQDEFFQVSQVDDRVGNSAFELVVAQVQEAHGSHATEGGRELTSQKVAFEVTKQDPGK